MIQTPFSLSLIQLLACLIRFEKILKIPKTVNIIIIGQKKKLYRKSMKIIQNTLKIEEKFSDVPQNLE